MEDIKFGFWNYAPYGILGAEQVARWKDSGFNLPMSFRYEEGESKRQDVLTLLDACEDAGLPLLMNDDRLNFRRLGTLGKEAYLDVVKTVHREYGDHPSVYGFYVGDEPQPEETQMAIDAYRLIQQEMPSKKHFLNLLPYWGSADPFLECGKQTPEEFEDLLRKILVSTDAPYIGFDHYTQCLQEGLNQEDGVATYFYDLDEYCKITKEKGIPFYVSLLAVGHWFYRTPSANDIRWQISTAFAHGARGIIWFYYYQTDLDLSYRDAPFGGKTLRCNEVSFQTIANETQRFLGRYQHYFNRMELVKVMHFGHLYDPQHRFVADSIISRLEAKLPYPVCISYYRDLYEDRIYISLVNLDFTHSNDWKVTLTNGKTLSTYLAPGEMALLDPQEARFLGA